MTIVSGMAIPRLQCLLHYTLVFYRRKIQNGSFIRPFYRFMFLIRLRKYISEKYTRHNLQLFLFDFHLGNTQ